MMEPIKTVRVENTMSGAMLIRPDKASRHGLGTGWYVLKDRADYIPGHAEGTHDGIRSSAQNCLVQGRYRLYYRATDWHAEHGSVPDATPDELALILEGN
jgi:hypothetical protein